MPNSLHHSICVVNVIGFDYIHHTHTYTHRRFKLLAARRRVPLGGRPDSLHQWCIDNGFEYVLLSSGDENGDDLVMSSSAAGVMDDQGDDDPLERLSDGVDRIREALHAHMWSNLVLKQRGMSTTLAD